MSTNNPDLVLPDDKSIDQNELREFISSSMQAIFWGIDDCISEFRPNSGKLRIVGGLDGKMPLIDQVNFCVPSEIEFDIAVTVARKSGKEGGLKVHVLSVGANVENEQAVATRLNFKVPIEWAARQK